LIAHGQTAQCQCTRLEEPAALPVSRLPKVILKGEHDRE